MAATTTAVMTSVSFLPSVVIVIFAGTTPEVSCVIRITRVGQLNISTIGSC